MKNTPTLLLVASMLISSLCFAGDKISPETIAGATTINVERAKALFDEGVIFIDVRKDKDWEAGRIPDAAHIELKKKLSEASLLEETGKADKVVFYCNGTSCLRSSKASTQAVGWGFKQVFYFRDGYPAWKTAGYSTE